MAVYKMEIQLSDGSVINAGTFEVKEGGKPLLKNVTLSASGWMTSADPAGWKYVITDADITENSIVDFIQDNSSAEAWASIGAYPMTVSSNGSVALYAESKPSVNIEGYYSITDAELEIVASYEDRVAAAYPDYTVLHGTLTPGNGGAPPELTITSGTLAAGNKAIIIDSAVIGEYDATTNVFIGTGNADYYGGSDPYPDEYPPVTPNISANTTLLLWNASTKTMTSKANGEV